MGNSCSGRSQNNRTLAVETALKEQKKSEKNNAKLLLLGTGDSGKSTFAKQLRIMHRGEYPAEECVFFARILKENALYSMRSIIMYVRQKNPDLLKEFSDDEISGLMDLIELDSEHATLINNIWQVKGIRRIAKKKVGLDIQIPSVYAYYFTNCIRFCENDYTPTTQDILMAKIKTTVISETNFTVEGINFSVVDVGGQRSERRKWLHCFDGVTALNDYYMVLEEDETASRLEESLELFSDVTGSGYFQDKHWIIFLNKKDIFKDLIKSKPLSQFFDDVDFEDSNYEKACEYMAKKYENMFRDTKNCTRVFNSVREDVIVRSMLGAWGGAQ